MKFGGKVVIISGACSSIARQAAIDSTKAGRRERILVSQCEPKLELLASDIAKMSTWLRRTPVRLRRSDNADILRMSRDDLDRLTRLDGREQLQLRRFQAGKGPEHRRDRGYDCDKLSRDGLLTKAFLDSMLVRKSGHIVNTDVHGAANRSGGVFFTTHTSALIILHRRLQKQMMRPAARTRRPSAGARAAQNGRSPSCRVQTLSLTLRPAWGQEAR